MSDVSSLSQPRPLFTGGQALRSDVQKRTQNPGDKYYPVGIEQALPLLVPQADQLVAYFSSLPIELRDDRVYIEAIVRPNFIAPSWFPARVFALADAFQVGTRGATWELETASKREPDQVTKSLILSISESGLNALPALLRSARDSGDSALANDVRKIAELRLSVPEPVTVPAGDAPDSTLRTFEAVLNPVISAAGAPAVSTETVMRKFIAFAVELGGEVVSDYARSVGTLTFVPIRLDASRLGELYRFNPLRSIQLMPEISEPMSFDIRGVSVAIAPSSGNAQRNDISVGVFDGGVGSRGAGSTFFPDLDVELTSQVETTRFTDHGTSVVGLVKYGLLDAGDSAAPAPLETQSYRLFPVDGPANDLYCYWALDRIKEVIENGTHEIYNLSLGPALPVDDAAIPNRWTAELDDLARRNRVLLVVAAGNNGAASGAGKDRIEAPADGINVLGVGATDTPQPDHWTRAPYSAKGPGRYGGRIQPLVVQYGGTDAAPMPLLRADGRIRHDRGTSFSAPQVTHALAELAGQLDDADPDMLRAFAVHFAERPAKTKMRELGYGRVPLSLLPSLECGANDVHVLYQDRIQRQQNAAYEIPVPATSSATLRVRVTLVFLAETDPSDAFEYSKSAITMTLRPDENLFSWTRQGTTSIDSRRGTAQAVQLANAGYRESRHPKSLSTAVFKTKGKDEKSLREEGKWETVTSASFTLRPDSYDHPRLHLAYTARERGSLRSTAAPLPFALLTSVHDEAETGTLYDEVLLRFPQLVQVPLIRAQLKT
jgi:hypothetical protein